MRLVNRQFSSLASDASLYRSLKLVCRDGPDETEASCAADFDAQLDALPPHLLAAVQRIYIMGTAESIQTHAMSAPVARLAEFTADMPSLTSLDLSTVESNMIASDLLNALPVTLRELSGPAAGTTVIDKEQLALSLARLTALECLSWEAMHVAHLAIPFDALVHLRRLSLSFALATDLEALMAAILASPCRATLELLKVNYFTGHAGEWWRDLPKLPALTELACVFDDDFVDQLSDDSRADLVDVLTTGCALTVADLDISDAALLSEVVSRMPVLRCLFACGPQWTVAANAAFLPPHLVHLAVIADEADDDDDDDDDLVLDSRNPGFDGLAGSFVEAVLTRCPRLETLATYVYSPSCVEVLLKAATEHHRYLNLWGHAMDKETIATLRAAGHRVDDVGKGGIVYPDWREPGGFHFGGDEP